MIKKAAVVILTIVALNASLTAQEVLDKIVAVVDDNIILRSELQQFSYNLAIQSGLDPTKDVDKFNAILQRTLGDLITQKVLLVKAKEDSVIVAERQVDDVLNDQIQNIVRQLGSEKRVEEYFGSPLRQIRREFRKEVEERLLVQRLRETKNAETQISRREVERFYKAYRDSLPVIKEGVKLRHILVNVEPSSAAVAAAKQKAEEVLARLRKGEDFETLAKEFSDDPGTAARGGNLGVMQRGDLVREYEEAALALEPGQLSGIVQSKFGLHIIQLIQKIGVKINTRHILFRVDSSPDDEENTRKRLEKLNERIQAGELTFSEAAKQNSKDEQTALSGGDLSWFDTAEFQIEAFKEAVANLQEGDISEPVKTRFGLHLIKVEERRAERKLEISKDWEQIEKWALDLKRTNEFEKYVEDIKKGVYIELKGL